jgi:flagellar assembly factor FliW
MATMTENVQKISFIEPMPGFADHGAYTLAAIDEHGLLYSLRSAHDPGLRFVLTRATTFFADYQPDVGGVAGVLGGDDVDLMLVLTIRTGLADATANLRAPIAVSASSGRAVQLVLDDDSLPMQQPLLHNH